MTKKERDKLRKRICKFCEAQLTLPAEGYCGAIWKINSISGAECGWVAAFAKLGIDEALRQSKLPMEQRTDVFS